jgi:hypothetical protein
VNDIRRLSFPPPTPPRGRGVSGQAIDKKTTHTWIVITKGAKIYERSHFLWNW